MFGIDTNMPTKLKKRRVVYVDDDSWFVIESVASMQNKSASEALREILQRVMQKERKNLYINPF